DNLCTYWRPFSWVQGAARRHEDSVESLCGSTFGGGGHWAPRFFACVVRHTPTQRNPNPCKQTPTRANKPQTRANKPQTRAKKRPPGRNPLPGKENPLAPQ